MTFCNQCGTRLVEGEIHQCPAQSAMNQVAATAYTNVPSDRSVQKSSGVNLNLQTILTLITDPFMGVRLSLEEGFKYGVLGFFASVIGVYCWFLAFYHQFYSSILKLIEQIGGKPNIKDLLTLDKVFQLNYIKDLFAVLLVIGVYSLAVLLIFSWLGDTKRSFKHSISVLGSVQWFAVIGFVLAAILSFVSTSASVGVLLIALLTNAVIVLFSGVIFYGVKESKQILAVVLVFAINTIVSGLILKYFLTEGVQSSITSLNGIIGSGMNDMFDMLKLMGVL